MKKIFLFAAIAILAVSCMPQAVVSTNKLVDIKTSVFSATSAELDINPVKITYTMSGKEIDNKLGLVLLKDVIMSKAIVDSKCDILVEPRYVIDSKGFDVKSITITGYPAKYKNYKSFSQEQMVEIYKAANSSDAATNNAIIRR